MDSAYFLTMVLNYDESGPAPTGTFEIEILDSSASCTVNLRTNQSTCSDDFEVRRVDGRVEVLVSGWMPTGAGTFSNYRLLYHGDDYYANSASPLYDSVQRISKPTVEVLSANRNGTVTFKINGYDSVYSKYLIIDRVGLESYGIGTSYPKYINILDLPVTDSDITIKRSGDTFTVTNFPGADNYIYYYCEVSLNSLNNKYWREGTIYHHISFSAGFTSASPLTSGSPVTLSVTLGGE